MVTSTACSSNNNEGKTEKPTTVPSSTTSHTTTVSTNPEQINLNKYVSVTFEGYDLAGRASVKFDKEKFLLDHINHVSFNEDNLQVYQELYGATTKSAANTVVNYISVDLDKTRQLNNGDTVKLVWKIDTDKTEAYFEWNYICTPEVYTVTGLTTAPTFDPFEKLNVTFTGTAPYGTASVYNYGQNYRYRYAISPNSNLKNGDKIVVTYCCDDKATMIGSYGLFPASTQKEYTVTGLNTYVQSFEELTIAQQNQVVAHAKEQLWVLGYGNYQEAKYCGTFFYTTKENPTNAVSFSTKDYNPVGNAICFVFQHPKEIGKTDSPNVYTIIALENLLINEKNELVYSKHTMEQMMTQYESREDLTNHFLENYSEFMNCSNNTIN